MSASETALWPAGDTRELDVLGVGESSCDTLCITDEPPDFGGKQELAAYAVCAGGQVATAVLACAKLGLRAGLIGSVGDDPQAEVALAALREHGVDLAGVKVVPGAPTRQAVILVDRASGERAVLGHRDPRLSLSASELNRDLMRRARALHLDTTDPELSVWAAQVARSEGIPVMLDADRRWPNADKLLATVDFPVVSRRLAEELGGTGSVRDGLRSLGCHGARLAVVTLGNLGALAGAGERIWQSPGFRVPVADLTGAGDGFRGGFLWALLEGFDPAQVLRVANAVGALNCQALGAQGGLPNRSELESFLRSHSPESWRDPGARVGR